MVRRGSAEKIEILPCVPGSVIELETASPGLFHRSIPPEAARSACSTAGTHAEPLAIDKARRAERKHQNPCIVWFTGLSGSGKSTIARLVDRQLSEGGYHTYMLDGDNLRRGLNRDLGFTQADRVENVRRAGEVARLFVDAGLIVLCALISPFRAERRAIREHLEPGEFIEVFVNAPLEECERRDPKGLYAKARSGALLDFTGIDSPYEEPESPDLVLDTVAETPHSLAERVVSGLRTRKVIS